MINLGSAISGTKEYSAVNGKHDSGVHPMCCIVHRTPLWCDTCHALSSLTTPTFHCLHPGQLLTGF